MTDTLRILIAEHQYLLREGTRRLLEEVDGLEVVGTAADYDEAVRQARALHPDVALMDVKMPPTETTEGNRHRIHQGHQLAPSLGFKPLAARSE